MLYTTTKKAAFGWKCCIPYFTSAGLSAEREKKGGNVVDISFTSSTNQCLECELVYIRTLPVKYK